MWTRLTGTSRFGKCLGVILRHTTHSQGKANRSESYLRQFQTSGDVRIPYISYRRTKTWSETLFRILAWFWWKMVNKEVDQFLRVFKHLQWVNSCAHESHQLLYKIESDTSFAVVLIDFWGPGGILDQYWSCKILTWLDYIKGFGIWSASGMKDITL